MKLEGPIILDAKAIAAMHETYEQTAARMKGWLEKPSRAELREKYGEDREERSEEDELRDMYPRGE